MASESSNSGPLSKVCRVPLRLATGWSRYPKKLSLIAALVLVILRLSIGWHFYTEGAAKVQNGFDSSYFLQASRGPFAEHFKAMVWDGDGRLRLRRDVTEGSWQHFRKLIAAHYQFDKKQQNEANGVLERTLKQYDWVMDVNAEDLKEIELGRTRIADLEKRPERTAVASLEGQKQIIWREWRQKLDPILAEVDNTWENLERDMNGIANEDQQRRGYMTIALPRTQRIDTTVMDKVIPWFDVTIGALLLIGLFTPVAALAAAGFLFSVFLSQFPPTGGPGSTYYQLIEAMACLVLASTGAGRFAGLDALIHAALHRGGTNDKG